MGEKLSMVFIEHEMAEFFFGIDHLPLYLYMREALVRIQVATDFNFRD